MLNKTPKKAKDLYKKVVKLIPGVEEKELRIKYSKHPKLDYAGLFLMDEWLYTKFKIIVKRPKIGIDQKFMDLENSEQEAIIAHELGHYKRERRYNTKELKTLLTRLNKMHGLFDDRKISPHNGARLIQWYVLHEIYADNVAIDAGYGQPLLSFLKKMYQVYETLPDFLKYDQKFLSKRIEFNKKSLVIRIKNLEDKLKD